MIYGMTPVQNIVLKALQDGKPLDGLMIYNLIQDHRTTAVRTKRLYDRYRATNVPVLSRTMPSASKINSKINNDFFGEIIDTKVGYMAGIPINYELDKNHYEDTKSNIAYKKHTDTISKFNMRNNINDLDAELIKKVSICGLAGRKVYIDTEGNERVVNLDAWETIFLANIHNEVEYAVRYYVEKRFVGVTVQEGTYDVTKVEFYDKSQVTYLMEYKDQEGTATYIYDNSEPVNPKPHLFDYCPIVKIVNNEEELGDAEKVLALIDAYDRTLSDISSEIEQFRLAYMYFKGEEPTAEVIEQAKQTGGYYVGENGEVGFITKNINDAVVEHHLDRLEENILRFAKHVNFSDQNFAGNLSGVAMQYKLMALENKSSVLQTKMTTALRQQIKILASAWSKKSIVIDYLDVFFSFKRNLPLNLLDEADTSAKLKGLVSERTRLGKLSFVDDIDYELEQMAQDATGSVDLLTPLNATQQFDVNGQPQGVGLNGDGSVQN